MQDRYLRSGAVLYVEGEPSEHVYFVRHGQIALSRAVEARGERTAVWAVRRKGSMFGLEALVAPAYADSARAVGDSVVCIASRRAVEAWLHGERGAPLAVLGCLIEAQRGDGPRRCGADGSAGARVAAWLSTRGVEVDLPRVVIADLLGMQPETLSRSLAQLARRGALRVTRRSIEVLDRELLKTIANGTAAADDEDANAR